MLSTTKECFEFIAKNWTKEMYKKEKERYKKICSHILSNETETSITCYRCNTIWDNKNMVSNWHGCSQCDKTAQPCLSNPINKEYVLKYIPKQHHRYLLSTIDIYGLEIIKCNSGKVICTLRIHILMMVMVQMIMNIWVNIMILYLKNQLTFVLLMIK